MQKCDWLFLLRLSSWTIWLSWIFILCKISKANFTVSEDWGKSSSVLKGSEVVFLAYFLKLWALCFLQWESQLINWEKRLIFIMKLFPVCIEGTQTDEFTTMTVFGTMLQWHVVCTTWIHPSSWQFVFWSANGHFISAKVPFVTVHCFFWVFLPLLKA